MGKSGRLSPSVAALICAFALTGCASGPFSGFWSRPQPQPPAAQPLPAPEIPATIRASEIVGRWGYAAYHRPEDRVRTEAAARGQCAHPYIISAGPTGGVMMYLADESQLRELRLRGGPGGRNFIGPAEDPAGGPRDREIMSFDGRVMILRFVDPEVHSRYGTGVYVRCAPRPGGVARRHKTKKKQKKAQKKK
jgi:hypothetical protein